MIPREYADVLEIPVEAPLDQARARAAKKFADFAQQYENAPEKNPSRAKFKEKRDRFEQILKELSEMGGNDAPVEVAPAEVPSGLPEAVRDFLKLTPTDSLDDALLEIKRRLETTRKNLADLEKTGRKHPSKPAWIKEVKKLEDYDLSLRDENYGPSIDAACDQIYDFLDENPPKRSKAREALKRAKLESKRLNEKSEILERVKKAAALLEDRPSPGGAIPTPEPPPATHSEPAVQPRLESPPVVEPPPPPRQQTVAQTPSGPTTIEQNRVDPPAPEAVAPKVEPPPPATPAPKPVVEPPQTPPPQAESFAPRARRIPLQQPDPEVVATLELLGQLEKMIMDPESDHAKVREGLDRSRDLLHRKPSGDLALKIDRLEFGFLTAQRWQLLTKAENSLNRSDISTARSALELAGRIIPDDTTDRTKSKLEELKTRLRNTELPKPAPPPLPKFQAQAPAPAKAEPIKIVPAAINEDDRPTIIDSGKRNPPAVAVPIAAGPPPAPAPAPLPKPAIPRAQEERFKAEHARMPVRDVPAKAPIEAAPTPKPKSDPPSPVGRAPVVPTQPKAPAAEPIDRRGEKSSRPVVEPAAAPVKTARQGLQPRAIVALVAVLTLLGWLVVVKIQHNKDDQANQIHAADVIRKNEELVQSLLSEIKGLRALSPPDRPPTDAELLKANTTLDNLQKANEPRPDIWSQIQPEYSLSRTWVGDQLTLSAKIHTLQKQLADLRAETDLTKAAEALNNIRSQYQTSTNIWPRIKTDYDQAQQSIAQRAWDKIVKELQAEFQKLKDDPDRNRALRRLSDISQQYQSRTEIWNPIKSEFEQVKSAIERQQIKESKDRELAQTQEVVKDLARKLKDLRENNPRGRPFIAADRQNAANFLKSVSAQPPTVFNAVETEYNQTKTWTDQLIRDDATVQSILERLQPLSAKTMTDAERRNAQDYLDSVFKQYGDNRPIWQRLQNAYDPIKKSLEDYKKIESLVQSTKETLQQIRADYPTNQPITAADRKKANDLLGDISVRYQTRSDIWNRIDDEFNRTKSQIDRLPGMLSRQEADAKAKAEALAKAIDEGRFKAAQSAQAEAKARDEARLRKEAEARQLRSPTKADLEAQRLVGEMLKLSNTYSIEKSISSADRSNAKDFLKSIKNSHQNNPEIWPKIQDQFNRTERLIDGLPSKPIVI